MSIKFGNSKADQKNYPFQLPELPYKDTALEPHMSAETFSFHHKKHHAAYVNNLNALIEDSDFAKLSLEEIITKSKDDKPAIFNNAAQVWNHSFFWHSMSPKGGGKPKGELMQAIESSFGNYENFISEFKAAATTQFGSGWAWLVARENKLSIIKTSNAETPITEGYKTLINCDVWEHAYYLDYQNRRPDYVSVFLENLINWDFADYNFKNE